MTTIIPPSDSSEAARLSERRHIWRLVAWFAPFTLLGWLLLPNLGPFFVLHNSPSASMYPAVFPGSVFLASRASYGYSRHSFDLFQLPITGRIPAVAPKRGDIIVFRLQRNLDVRYVKRVVGLPGEKVQMVGGRLSINDELVRVSGASPWPGPSTTELKSVVEHLPGGPAYRVVDNKGAENRLSTTQVVTVPAGHVFVLGDHRGNSLDSRTPISAGGLGFVPVELITARVILHY